MPAIGLIVPEDQLYRGDDYAVGYEIVLRAATEKELVE